MPNGGDDHEDFKQRQPDFGDDSRAYIWREIDQIRRYVESLDRKLQALMDTKLPNYVTKEVFETNVKPIQKIMWLIFSVITSALVLAVLGLVIQSSKGLK
jgi:hypothetical protein